MAQPKTTADQLNLTNAQLLGNSTAITQALGNSSTRVATTEFVQNNGGGGFDSGQTWTSDLYVNSRFANTTYANNYGHPIVVQIVSSGSGGSIYGSGTGFLKTRPAGGGYVANYAIINGGDPWTWASIIVPNTWEYELGGSSLAFPSWYELR